MKSGWFILLLSFAFQTLLGQADSARLATSAIEIGKPDSLSTEIYNALHPYKLIMIGEMHGTNEPAAFVKGLAQLFASHKDSVRVGFEIPSDQMKEFMKAKTERSVYNSTFFKMGSADGRASEAWASCIASLAKKPLVRIFFFDVNSDESKNKLIDKDSLMYLKIKNEIEKHPSAVVITLSGNIHNMLLAYKGENKIARYFIKDKNSSFADNMCSLNHTFKSGSMLNNTRKGLLLSKMDNGTSEYSKFTKYNDYLFLFPSKQYAYNGVLFTRTVTAVKLVSSAPLPQKYVLNETFNEMDVPGNEYLVKELKPIRDNFKRINSISEWDSIYSKTIATAEKLKFYYKEKRLEKFTERSNQGIEQILIEYYFLKGQLSFVVEKSFDKTLLDAAGKPEIIETKTYFEKGKLLHMASTQDCGAPFDSDFLLNEEKRIKKHVEQLLKFK